MTLPPKVRTKLLNVIEDVGFSYTSHMFSGDSWDLKMYREMLKGIEEVLKDVPNSGSAKSRGRGVLEHPQRSKHGRGGGKALRATAGRIAQLGAKE